MIVVCSCKDSNHLTWIERIPSDDFTEKNRKGHGDRKDLPEKNPDKSAQSAAFFSELIRHIRVIRGSQACDILPIRNRPCTG